MKKPRKYRAKTNRDDVPATGGHIDLMRIQAFASESINFTDEETAHFDVCRRCRLKVVDALRKGGSQVVRAVTTKAA